MSDYARYQLYFNVFQFAFMCVVGAFSWWRTREKADAAAINAAKKEMQKSLDEAKVERDKACTQHKLDSQRFQDKVDRLNDIVKELPSRGELSRLHKRFDEIHAMVSGLGGELLGIKNNVSLLLENHLKGGK